MEKNCTSLSDRLLLGRAWRECCSLAVFLLVPLCVVQAQGSRATFLLSSGKELTGEILFVRGDTLILTTHAHYWASKEKLIASPEEITFVAHKDIQAAKFLGMSHLMDGLTLGFIGGICIGSLMAFDPHADALYSYDEAGMDVKAIVIFAGVGTALGCVTGITTSTKDLGVDTSAFRHFKYFKQFARYQEEEPDFLSKWETAHPNDGKPLHN